MSKRDPSDEASALFVSTTGQTTLVERRERSNRSDTDCYEYVQRRDTERRCRGLKRRTSDSTAAPDQSSPYEGRIVTDDEGSISEYVTATTGDDGLADTPGELQCE